jgi:hypothetical protein
MAFTPAVLATGSEGAAGVVAGSDTGIGVSGTSATGTGIGGTGAVGVNGYCNHANGIGVLGQGAVSAATGVQGRSANGVGVWGESNDPTGAHCGVYGKSSNGTGVCGEGGNTGVFGTGTSYGVFGSAPSSGVIGLTTSDSGFAVLGRNESTTGQAYGVLGVTDSRDSNAAGVVGSFGGTPNAGYGVRGIGGTYGVYGTSDTGFGASTGVFGESTTADGTGVQGIAHGGPSAWAVWGRSVSGLAGRFDGNVSIVGNLSKSGGSFKIDHPLDPANKYLQHAFVESPDMKNIYDGVVVLDANGEAVVEMPGWFDALNKECRYQLTCIGGFAPVYIAEELTDNYFKIAGGQAGMKVSWQVTGNRRDAYANAHRTPVEEDKPAEERGSYLHPELFDQPAEKSVLFAVKPQMTERMKEERERAGRSGQTQLPALPTMPGRA